MRVQFNYLADGSLFLFLFFVFKYQVAVSAGRGCCGGSGLALNPPSFFLLHSSLAWVTL